MCNLQLCPASSPMPCPDLYRRQWDLAFPSLFSLKTDSFQGRRHLFGTHIAPDLDVLSQLQTLSHQTAQESGLVTSKTITCIKMNPLFSSMFPTLAEPPVASDMVPQPPEAI